METLFSNDIPFHEVGALAPLEIGDGVENFGFTRHRVFACGDCAALVTDDGIGQHGEFHAAIETIESRTLGHGVYGGIE